MQLSTVISDGVLAAVSFYSAWMVYAGSRSGAIGLALVGAASLAGVFRFSILPQIAPLHSTLSAFAGQVGIPLIGLSFMYAVFRFPPTPFHVEMIGVALLAICLLNRWVLPIPLYGIIIGAVAALLIIGAGVRSLPGVGGSMAIAGALILVVAGLAIGSSGELMGFKRVDLYHYALALSMWLMGSSLRQLG